MIGSKYTEGRSVVSGSMSIPGSVLRVYIRVSNRNSVAHYVAERNAIFTAITARFVAHIPLPLAPNLRLKVSFLAHQQCRILGAIKVTFPINFIYF